MFKTGRNPHAQLPFPCQYPDRDSWLYLLVL